MGFMKSLLGIIVGFYRILLCCNKKHSSTVWNISEDHWHHFEIKEVKEIWGEIISGSMKIVNKLSDI